MSHYLTNDDEYRDLLYGDDYRSYLMARSKSPDGYKFGRIHGRRVRVHARSALRRVNGYFRSMIEAIANSKLRRMERELELRGIRFDQSNESWLVRTPRPADR
jgi:GDP-D-mannose dehydratase